MLYRAGYSYKDPGQERILALRMRHADFIGILERGVAAAQAEAVPDAAGDLAEGGDGKGSSAEKDETAGEGKLEVATGKERKKGLPEVRIQWDPERTVRLGRLDHRSIQIGIPGSLSERWTEEMIVGIEDVTEKARELKRVLDERADFTLEELVELGLVPVERPFELPEELQRGLGMIAE